jgi:hypothetical protein
MQKSLVYIVLISTMLFGASAQYIVAQSYNSVQANATLVNATAYVKSINQSAYLLFYPNLSESYKYLGMARSTSQNSPSYSIYYSGLAVSSANASYSMVNSYRYLSLLAVTIFTIAMAILLYKFMKPVKKKR